MAIYSHSRLSTFENCPLQFKYQYIDKIKRYEQGIEAFVGSRFHDSMEKLYGELKFKILSLEELLDYYEAQWEKEYTAEVKITKKDRTLEDYRNVGRKCIEDYYKRYHPFNQSRTLGIEKAIKVDLNGDGKHQVQGYIDRLAQAEDGTYEIIDYKTSAHLPEQKYLDQDRQLALYQIGVQSMWNDVKSVKLVWHYVVFDKEVSSVRSADQLEALKEDIIGLIDKIESTKEFLPNETSLCNWCGYHDLCPLKSHIQKVESLPANEYFNDNGVKLVNKFQEFDAKRKEHQGKIKEINEEREKVKEAILAYAQRENLQVIKGSGYKVKISEKKKYDFPSKGTEKREEIENIINEAGLREEFESLDTHTLQKAIEERKIPDSLVEKLLKYITIEPQRNVLLSKEKSE